MKHRKRVQSTKTENKPYIIAMRELRRSNAAQPHRNHTRYDRNDYRAQAQRGAI